MRVCLLTTSFPQRKNDTQAPFIYELCSALAKKGIRIDVICPAEVHAKKEEIWGNIHVHRFQYMIPRQWQRLTAEGGMVTNLKSSWIAKTQWPIFSLVFLWKALHHAKKADIIHCQWSFSGVIGVMLKKMLGKKLILTERGSSAHLALKNKAMKATLLYILKNCDMVTANNQHQIGQFYRLGIKKPMMTIPNGIDMKLFRKMDQKVCKKRIKLPEDQRAIVYVGRLVEDKGLEMLMQVMYEVKKRRKDIKCYVIGSGRLEKELKKRVNNLKVQERVIFMGSIPQKEIPYYLNAADALVLPSLREGRPNVVAEALACGTFVIASDIPGCGELLSLLPHGKLLPPQNTEKWINAIVALRIKKIDRKKYEAFRKELTWEKSAEKYEAVYKKIISRKQGY